MAVVDSQELPLSLQFRKEGPETVLVFEGTLNGSLDPEQRDQVFAAARRGCRLVLDFTKLGHVSSAGLRMLLLYCRHVQAMGGTISSTGITQELRDVAEAAGFSRLFQQVPLHMQELLAPRPQRLPIDAYPTHVCAGFALRAGFPLPLGATLVPRGINFSIYSRHATACTLVVFEQGSPTPVAEIPFPDEFRLGDVFAMTVFELDPDRIEYGFRIDGPHAPASGHRFDRTKILLDPAAHAIAGLEQWGVAVDYSHPAPFRARLVPEDFDWEGDRPLQRPVEDLIIYEMHVRSFTQSPTSRARFRGTFAGVREKIPYLKELGVNAVELMPVFQFDEMENPRTNPLTGERLFNYWGYSTVGFYAPNSGYAASGKVGMQGDEFKSLVKELHYHGIEVILDVVFNHTAEGNENGPTISFRGIDNRTYYLLTPGGHYYNFSGCGNTLNCNHPVVRDLVVDCLRHWVSEYHIDGFRFDLASILGRDQKGVPLANPPLLEALAADPVLGRTKLIAEAWDAAGLYQVGSFPAYARWAEWNGKFRDCVRRFLKGDFGETGEMAARIVGSPDLYLDRGPTTSINFVTCHDGFTLADLVSFNEKHNEANGEQNRDGTNDNYSWNCGVEGPTENPAIQTLRLRQTKNAMAMLLLSQGVPMLLMGDECGRTQQGNNNAYCHDSPLNWFDWTLPQKNAEMLRFCQRMIAFRKRHPALRHPLYAGQHDANGDVLEVNWHGTRAWSPDWSAGNRVLAFSLRRYFQSGKTDDIYVAMNMHSEALEFELPSLPSGQRWHQFANTALKPPHDIALPDEERPLDNQTYLMCGSRSVVVLVPR